MVDVELDPLLADLGVEEERDVAVLCTGRGAEEIGALDLPDRHVQEVG